MVIPDGRVFISTTNRDFAGAPSADDDKIIELKNEDFLSLNEFNTESFTLYPNPSDGLFTIKLVRNLDSDSELEIYDINGN